nr:complement factor H-related protein 4-like isoform X1 [Loxodonta africana]
MKLILNSITGICVFIHHWEGTPNMLFVINVLLTLWVSCAEGQVKPCDFPEIKNGYLHYQDYYRPYFPVELGKYYYYYCNSGFVTPEERSGGYITCRREGWSPSVPCLKTCSKSDTLIANGFFSESEYSYPVNKQTQYKCKSGYMTADGKTSGSITCLESGWSTQPVCIKSCDKPSFVNARPKSNGTWFKLSDQLDYECSAGYENTGGSTTGSIVCGDDGWSDTPTCYDSEGKCGFPPPIENGDITSFPLPTYAQGSTAEYQCQAFCELQGDKHITCRNGQWSEAPKCLEACVVSEEMMEMHNIKLKWKYDKGIYSKTSDTVEFTCKWGYTAKTPRATFRARCQEGKLEYPSCEKSYFG